MFEETQGMMAESEKTLEGIDISQDLEYLSKIEAEALERVAD